MDTAKFKRALQDWADEAAREVSEARRERDEARKALLDEQAAHERTKKEVANATSKAKATA